MKRGTVEPIQGEPGRYYVESFGASHDSNERYLVDLSLSGFGCGCADWDYRRRPECKGLLALGKLPPDLMCCKHIAQARQYRDKWEHQDANARALVGQIALFEHKGKWLLGEVVQASPAPPDGPEPDFNMTVKGRSGRTLDIEFLGNRVFLVDDWQTGELYLQQL